MPFKDVIIDVVINFQSAAYINNNSFSGIFPRFLRVVNYL